MENLGGHKDVCNYLYYVTASQDEDGLGLSVVPGTGKLAAGSTPCTSYPYWQGPTICPTTDQVVAAGLANDGSYDADAHTSACLAELTGKSTAAAQAEVLSALFSAWSGDKLYCDSRSSIISNLVSKAQAASCLPRFSTYADYDVETGEGVMKSWCEGSEDGSCYDTHGLFVGEIGSGDRTVYALKSGQSGAFEMSQSRDTSWTEFDGAEEVSCTYDDTNSINLFALAAGSLGGYFTDTSYSACGGEVRSNEWFSSKVTMTKRP